MPASRMPCFFGCGKIGCLNFGIVERQFVIRGKSPQADFDTFESQTLGQGDGFQFSCKPQVPVCYANFDSAASEAERAPQQRQHRS